MKPGQHFTRGDLQAGILVTALFHLFVAVAVGAMAVSKAVEEEEELIEEEPSVEVVVEDDPWEESDWDPLPTVEEEEEEPPLDLVEEETPPEEEDTEQQEEEVAEQEEAPAPEDQQLDRYAVEQVTDGEEPEQADHISDEAHTADEETVADVTTLEDALPEEDLEAPEIDREAELELAMQIPMEDFEEPEIVEMEEEDLDEEFDDEELQEEEPTEEIVEDSDEEEELDEELVEYRDPNEMFVVDDEPGDLEMEPTVELEELFRRDPDRAREVMGEISEEKIQQERQTGRPGQGLLSRWEENDEAFRASLENFLPHVQPGNHTSVNARAAAHASYINRMHRSIHPRWAGDFIGRASRNHSMRDPINDLSLVVVVEIVIDAEDGEILEVGRARPSGHELYDAEAMAVVRSIGAQPNPPDSIVSPDGKVYIHWTFWRDMRQCGTFGVRILQLQDEADRRPVDR